MIHGTFSRIICQTFAHGQECIPVECVPTAVVAVHSREEGGGRVGLTIPSRNRTSQIPCPLDTLPPLQIPYPMGKPYPWKGTGTRDTLTPPVKGLGTSDQEGTSDQRYPTSPPPSPYEQTHACENITFP